MVDSKENCKCDVGVKRLGEGRNFARVKGWATNDEVNVCKIAKRKATFNFQSSFTSRFYLKNGKKKSYEKFTNPLYLTFLLTEPLPT